MLHHNFEDSDEICNRSGIQRLDFLSKIVTSLKDCVPLDYLETVLQNVTEQELSLENLKVVCNKSISNAADHHRSESLSSSLEMQTSETLIIAFLTEVANSFEMKLLQELSSYTEQKFETDYKQTFVDLKLNIFTDAFQEARNHVKEVFSLFLLDSILSVKEDQPFVFSQKDTLNTKVRKDQIASFLHEIVFPKKTAIMTDIFKRINGVLKETQDGLRRISTVIEDFTSTIAISDQQTSKNTNLII